LTECALLCGLYSRVMLNHLMLYDADLSLDKSLVYITRLYLECNT